MERNYFRLSRIIASNFFSISKVCIAIIFIAQVAFFPSFRNRAQLVLHSSVPPYVLINGHLYDIYVPPFFCTRLGRAYTYIIGDKGNKFNIRRTNKVYISEFVCGVLSTVIVEIIAAIIWAIHDDKKKK